MPKGIQHHDCCSSSNEKLVSKSSSKGKARQYQPPGSRRALLSVWLLVGAFARVTRHRPRAATQYASWPTPSLDHVRRRQRGPACDHRPTIRDRWTIGASTRVWWAISARALPQTSVHGASTRKTQTPLPRMWAGSLARKEAQLWH